MTDKRYIQLYGLFCVLAVLLIVAAFWTNSGEHIQANPAKFAENTLEPISVNTVNSLTKEYHFSTDQLNTGTSSLIFYTRHRFIDVYMDGTLTYSLQIETARFGNTAGCLWNFVDIPYGTKHAVIRVKTSYETMNDESIDFYYGNSKSCYEYLIKRALPALILGIINIVIGLFMIVCWLFTHRHIKTIRSSLFHIGFFSCILGLWSIMESEISGLLLKNQQAASFLRYIVVLFMSIPFLLFAKDFLRMDKKPGWKILFIFIMCWIPINIGLQLFQVYDMKQLVTASHIILIIILGYMGYGTLYKIRESKNGQIHFLKISFYGSLLLFVSVIINLMGYYTGKIMLELLGQTGFLLYVILIGLAAAKEVFTVFEAGQKAEIYRTLAIKDVLTGMYNRNAYIEEIGKITDPSNMMIVTFDLNNLKQCNDRQGHMYGDKYLIAAAKILESVFARFGDCYRIGGDEFCVIIKNIRYCNIADMVKEMKSQEEQYNQSSEGIFMQIACGYAVFDQNKDRDIEATRSRADEMMYENKKQLKLSQVKTIS